ncbi:hypothetical protein D1007_00217 [Hordeum vulgare]|nr:hypothetical protein D1007_00217 [Hordeum vulgare]
MVQENEISKKVTGKERGAPLFHDLSLAHMDIVDGGMRLGLVELTPCPKIGDPRPNDEVENAPLKKGIKFGCLQEFKIWLSEYAIMDHRSFVVDHSNQKVRNFSVSDGRTVHLHEFTLESTRLTWAPRFHPFLDQSQWPEYDGPHTVPDLELVVPTKGRRRKKRFRGDMDVLAGYTDMKQFGSGHFMEPPKTNNCA